VEEESLNDSISTIKTAVSTKKPPCLAKKLYHHHQFNTTKCKKELLQLSNSYIAWHYPFTID